MELGFAVRNQPYQDWLATAVEDVDYPRDAESQAEWLKNNNMLREGEAALSAARTRAGIPISPTSSTSSKDSNVTTSAQPEGRLKTLGYLMAYLNRKTVNAPATQSLIAPIEANPPKSGSYNTWIMTLDDSVLPRRKDLREPLQIQKHVAQTEYRVAGAELVSSVLDYDNEQDWLPKLQQLNTDLTFNENADQGAWFFDLTHLHVHFGIKDEEMSLDVAKTVCALYGLFENEIGSWLPSTQRESPWCFRLRQGMEKERLGYNEENDDVELLPGKRFTPREFTQRMYTARTLQQLKTEVSGWSAGEWVHPNATGDNPSFDINANAYPVKAREWVAVNISLASEQACYT